MGRDLQKRKRRSSRPAIRQPSSSAKSKRLLNPLGNSTIAKNWDKKETTTQNYRRLGLVQRLNAPRGGVEPNARSKKAKGRSTAPHDPFAIKKADVAVVSEVRAEFDASGRILQVFHDEDGEKKRKRENPLNDPLAHLDSDSHDDDSDGDAEEWGGIDRESGGEEGESEVVRRLEAEANRPVEKKPRAQSAREVEWLQRLVDKHGNDTAAMVRDRKLNPMQQTKADISGRIRKWKGI